MKFSRKTCLIGAFAISLFSLLLPAHAADPNKTVRFAFRVAETGFDPARESDRYSYFILEAVFDSLLTYDYLARPAKLKPNTVEAMPEVSDNGATYLFKIKKGIYFIDHPAFKGVRRELMAQDYAYSIRRFFDPEVRSPNLYFFEGKIIGADEAMEQAKKSGKYDYDKPIAGLEVLDRYTLRIRLKQPDYNFLYFMAMANVAAVAREVVEYYGVEEFRSHPVGTAAFYLKEWRRSSKMVLEANPGYREEYFEGTPEDTPYDDAIAENLKGKRLPLVGRVEVAIIEEPQPRWISFLNKEFDYLEQVPDEFINTAAPGGKLAPALAKQGIRMQRDPQLEITLTAFYNMDDPVIGGYAPDKIALRRAMNLAYNGEEEVVVARKGQAVRAEGVIAPGVVGYDPDFRSIAKEYNPAKAKALLDMYGYIDLDGDGYREMPDGSPLFLEFGSPPTAEYRDLDAVWLKSMNAIGIRIRFNKQRWPDLNKAGKAGTLQVGSFYAWGADYPDGDNFLQLLYGPNAHQSNYANFRLPEFDHLYDQAKQLPDSLERTRLYNEMTKLFLAYAPWRLGVHRIWTNLGQPWLLNWKKHPILREGWKYLDIDLDQLHRATS
jgi:ABC-type transport system substrate-binding protein